MFSERLFPGHSGILWCPLSKKAKICRLFGSKTLVLLYISVRLAVKSFLFLLRFRLIKGADLSRKRAMKRIFLIHVARRMFIFLAHMQQFAYISNIEWVGEPTFFSFFFLGYVIVTLIFANSCTCCRIVVKSFHVFSWYVAYCIEKREQGAPAC